MEVTFFKRRKIFKKTNALDLVPIRLMEQETREEGNVNILLPRFKHPRMARIMEPLKRDPYIRVKLDEFGTATWCQIDGSKTVRDICNLLKKEFPEKLPEDQETQERVSKFMTLLYQQRFISFRQIQK